MAIEATKRARLEAAGFKIGSAAEFLGLTPEESALVELKLALSQGLRLRRLAQKLSQAALARRLKSSQSRVAKMEAGDPSVTIDLIVKALLATGATLEEVGKIIAASTERP